MRLALVIGLLTGGLAGCGSTGEDPLVVGMELAYPPFEMTDEQGNPTGISVDMARALGEYLGREVRIQNMAFDGLIPALRTGKIDMILSSLTSTPERAESIAFSEPYLRTGLCLLTAEASGVEGIEDLNAEGKVVVVKRGTTGHTFATENLPLATLRALDRDGNAVLEVARGSADAFIYDQMSVLRHWKRNPEATKPLLTPFREESWAIGLRQGEDELLGQVNRFLLEYRAGGGFERLGARYLADEKAAFQELGVPFVF